MFVTNWISPTKIQKISEITNFFRHYFLSRTELKKKLKSLIQLKNPKNFGSYNILHYICTHINKM